MHPLNICKTTIKLNTFESQEAEIEFELGRGATLYLNTYEGEDVHVPVEYLPHSLQNALSILSSQLVCDLDNIAVRIGEMRAAVEERGTVDEYQAKLQAEQNR